MKAFQVLGLLLAAALAWAGTPFEEGEKLYAANEPEKARALLEEALETEPSNPKVYAYLGIVYEQLGDPERAIAIMQRGLSLSGALRPVLLLNIGDNYFRRGDLKQAETFYGEAIAADQSMAKAWLNRANARVNSGNHRGAITDYTMFLTLAPRARQKADVEKMIALLSGSLQKKEAEERDRSERERALMDQVLNALKNASDDARNLSTKSDRVFHEKEEEIDIER